MAVSGKKLPLAGEISLPPFKNNPVKKFRIPPPLQKRKIGFGGGVLTVKPPDMKGTEDNSTFLDFQKSVKL